MVRDLPAAIWWLPDARTGGVDEKSVHWATMMGDWTRARKAPPSQTMMPQMRQRERWVKTLCERMDEPVREETSE